METIARFTQAYSQAPWRKQMQYLGIFLLILILGALVAGIYLSVTARAATIGRSIQAMYRDKNDLEREIENLKTQLAWMTSSEEMEKRAIALGFHPRNQDEVIYLIVPGYTGRQPSLQGVNVKTAVSGTLLPSKEYTQSLFEWLKEQLFDPAMLLGEMRP